MAEILKNYLEKKLLNVNASIQWPEEEKKAFKSGKNGLLMFYNYLERRKMIADNKFSYKTGMSGSLKEAVAFVIFFEAFSCYASALHLGWNGHTTAATMLVRRMYELLVDLSFIFQKFTNMRVKRFVTMNYVSRYMRLVYLYPRLNHRQLITELKREIGINFDELKKDYLKYRKNFSFRKVDKHSGKITYTYSGDWSFGLIDKNHRSSIAMKAKKVGLGDLHYRLSYGIFSSKTHVDSWYIGSKAHITDDFIKRVTFSVLPDIETHFKPVITCGAQYITLIFIILAKVFNLYTLDTDKQILKTTEKIKSLEDYREFFKRLRIKSQSDF